MVGPGLARRLLATLKKRSTGSQSPSSSSLPLPSSSLLSPAVLWQLDVLAWLLTDASPMSDDWASALLDLCGPLFSLVIDSPTVGGWVSSSPSVQDAAVSVLRRLAVLNLPGVPTVAIEHYRRFVREHPHCTTFAPARADLSEVFAAMCDRQDQLEVMGECLTSLFSDATTQRNDAAHVAFLHLVTQDFEFAKQRVVASALAAAEIDAVAGLPGGLRSDALPPKTAAAAAAVMRMPSSTPSLSAASSTSLLPSESTLTSFDPALSSEDLVFADGGRR
jgi:hypothetical protein